MAGPVVSDIDMPHLTGVELCRTIRADPATATLPVIFVSGSLVPGDSRPVDAQATAILCKPFKPAELIACLDKALAAGHEPWPTAHPVPLKSSFRMII
nr:response regulator [Actinoplanes ianthinogenes]